MVKNNSGITLIVLVITIIVLIIIASISVYEGKELIAKSKVQTLETNMLIIQAKAKSYAEEIDAKIWTEEEEDKDSARNAAFLEKGFENPSSNLENKYIEQLNKDINSTNYISYTLSEKALQDMGLDDIDNENYIVVYDKGDYQKIDVIFNNGVTYKRVTYYTLSELKKALSGESNN